MGALNASLGGAGIDLAVERTQKLDKVQREAESLANNAQSFEARDSLVDW